jgi:large-conductance mechanosensitive channel
MSFPAGDEMLNWGNLFIFLMGFFWIAYAVYYLIQHRKWQTKTRKHVEKSLELEEQQLVVLREINEAIRQLGKPTA